MMSIITNKMECLDFSKASAYVDPDAKTIEIWDLFGTDYRELSEKLTELVNKTLTLDPGASFLEVAKEALADRLDEDRDEDHAGLVLVDPKSGYVFEPYKGEEDPLWDSLRPLIKNSKRSLKVSTWGTRFILTPESSGRVEGTRFILPDVPDDIPKGVQQIFDASGLRGKRSKATIKLRGTDSILQKTVRDCPGFETFMRRIIVEVETKDLHHIGVICRGGHHRSVTVAELLKFLYPLRTVEHLTIVL
jgi:hypothetical protein